MSPANTHFQSPPQFILAIEHSAARSADKKRSNFVYTLCGTAEKRCRWIRSVFDSQQSFSINEWEKEKNNEVSMHTGYTHWIRTTEHRTTGLIKWIHIYQLKSELIYLKCMHSYLAFISWIFVFHVLVFFTHLCIKPMHWTGFTRQKTCDICAFVLVRLFPSPALACSLSFFWSYVMCAT